MEKEFNDLVGKINAKLEEAGKALQEANKLAQEAGIPGLFYGEYNYGDFTKESREMVSDLDYKLLFREMDNAGWATSSLLC